MTGLAEIVRPRGFRALIGVAGPLAGVQLAQVALTTTDLAMLGALDVDAVAAGGLAILMYNQIRTMCVGVVTPVGNLVSGAVGRHEARDPGTADDGGMADEVRGVVRAAFVVSTAVGVLAAAVLIGLGLVLPWFGQATAVVEIAQPVMATLAPGLIAMLWLNVLRQFTVGMHRPGSLLAVTIVSIAVNAFLDGAFLFGWAGFPVLGVAGIGVATSLVQLLSFLAYFAIVRRDRQLSSMLSLRWWRADRRTMGSILRLGIPVSLTYGSEAGITSVATLVMGTFGPVALAAHNVVNQIAYIVYQVNIGLSQGASILVSRAAGRGEQEETGRTAGRVFVLAGALQVVVAAVYLLVPGTIVALFLGSGDAVVITAATTLLYLAILQQVTKGTQNIAAGLMRGLGNTKVGFRSSLIGYWVVGVPLMLLFAVGLGWQGPGVWLGLCCGFGATAALLLHKFRLHFG